MTNVYTVRYDLKQYGRDYRDCHRVLVADSPEDAAVKFDGWFRQSYNHWGNQFVKNPQPPASYTLITVTETTLGEFYDLAAGHDWYYEMSDDHSVWLAGERAVNRIREMIQIKGPEWAEIWTGFSKHYYSGPPWNTEQAPKPERPSE